MFISELWAPWFLMAALLCHSTMKSSTCVGSQRQGALLLHLSLAVVAVTCRDDLTIVWSIRHHQWPVVHPPTWETIETLVSIYKLCVVVGWGRGLVVCPPTWETIETLVSIYKLCVVVGWGRGLVVLPSTWETVEILVDQALCSVGVRKGACSSSSYMGDSRDTGWSSFV